MTDAVLGSAPVRGAPFAPQHRWDRNFYLFLVLATWFGIVMGALGTALLVLILYANVFHR